MRFGTIWGRPPAHLFLDFQSMRAVGFAKNVVCLARSRSPKLPNMRRLILVRYTHADHMPDKFANPASFPEPAFPTNKIRKTNTKKADPEA